MQSNDSVVLETLKNVPQKDESADNTTASDEPEPKKMLLDVMDHES